MARVALWRYPLAELRNIEVRVFWNMDSRNSVDNTTIAQFIELINPLDIQKQKPGTPFMAPLNAADSIAYRHTYATKNTNHRLDTSEPAANPQILTIAFPSSLNTPPNQPARR